MVNWIVCNSIREMCGSKLTTIIYMLITISTGFSSISEVVVNNNKICEKI